jgi:uncharacterized protein (DUF362 family)
MRDLTVGGLALMYGCSKDTTTPTPSENGDVPIEPTTKIVLYRTQNRAEGVKKVLELLDFPTVQGRHIVLKPNFNTADPAPASTHNDTLSQLVLELQGGGASAITLGERSYQRFEDVISQKGIDDLAAALGFDIVNLEEDSKTLFHRSDLHWDEGFYVPRTITEAEYIVSTCCLKTHGYGGVFTMSLKLSVGVLPEQHMSELHGSAYMRDMIAEINLAYTPDLIVLDGIKAFIDGGPSQGTVRDGDVMLAGTDRVAVDAVGVAILKDLGSHRVDGKIFQQEQIRRAVELGIGIEGPEQIEFLTPDEPSRQYAERLQSILADG